MRNGESKWNVLRRFSDFVNFDSSVHSGVDHIYLSIKFQDKGDKIDVGGGQIAIETCDLRPDY